MRLLAVNTFGLCFGFLWLVTSLFHKVVLITENFEEVWIFLDLILFILDLLAKSLVDVVENFIEGLIFQVIGNSIQSHSLLFPLGFEIMTNGRCHFLQNGILNNGD